MKSRATTTEVNWNVVDVVADWAWIVDKSIILHSPIVHWAYVVG